MKRHVICGLVVVALAAACGNEDTGPGVFSTGADGVTTGDDGTGDGDGDGSGESDGDADGEGPGDGDGEDGEKFDVGGGDGDGADDGGNGSCECGQNDWSYVWIANSGESTVSKINTRTLVEEGRYITRPDKAGNPSRTSVSVDGRAVAIANRYTGVVKIWTRTDDCDPNRNGMPGLQTSGGKNNVLAWGQDDCVEWYTPFAGKTVQRPVQWTPGEGECHENQKIWTTTGAMGSGPGQCGKSGVWVHRLDGETGVEEDTIHIPDGEFNCDHTGTDLGLGLGPYGGAVDFEGNFWFHGFGNGKLVRVDFESLTYEIFSGGGYGITVDTEGRVWLSSSISRFDYDTKEKKSANVSSSGGIAQDLQGRIWAAGQNGVVWVDMETLAIGDSIALPGASGQVKGVSVDVDGFIWAVRQGDTRAYKIDPDDYSMEFYDGLNQPYTYSDMTGGQISNVTCNPPEG